MSGLQWLHSQRWTQSASQRSFKSAGSRRKSAQRHGDRQQIRSQIAVELLRGVVRCRELADRARVSDAAL